MRKLWHISLAFLLLLSGAAAYDAPAAPLEFIYEHYSSDDGLPHNSISDIHQDRRGYLWLCTWYGLSRFDGNSFVNYMMLPGDYSNLSHNRILSVDEDTNGYLWVITYDYHLYRFDVSTETFVAIPSELPQSSYKDMIARHLHCDAKGNVWIAFDGNGLIKVAPDLTSTDYSVYGADLIGREIKSIYEDSSSSIYVVSESGITLIKDEKLSLISRSSDVVEFSDFGGKLYFALQSSLLIIDKETGEHVRKDVTSLEASEITSMTVTGSDRQNLYIGFRDNAVASVDTSSFEMRLHRRDMGRVRYLFPDSEGLLWIATDRTGIYSFEDSSDTFIHHEHTANVLSYYADTLACVIEKNDRLWIKMNNYGFGYYDRDSGQIIPLSNVKEQEDCRFMNGVACYHIDDSGVLWMSTSERGLERVTAMEPIVDIISTPTVHPGYKSSSEVRAMLRDSRDRIWVATKSRELFCYSSDFSQCDHFQNRYGWDLGVIYSIFEDDRGNIWLGTKGDGLVRLSKRGNVWERKCFKSSSEDPYSISSNNIYSIGQDNDGRIWVGTYGGGLSMLESPDAEKFVTSRRDFPNYPMGLGERVRYIHCMPDGRMLVATVGGLILFEPSANPELMVFNFIKKIPGDIHSLGNNDIIHIFTDSKGNTWLSTFGGGLNRLYFEDDMPRFEIISVNDGLASNIVLSATEDGAGTIWVATESGVSNYDPKTGEVRNFTKYDGLAPTTFSEATCVTLPDGDVAFGTLNNIYHIDPSMTVNQLKDSRLAVTGLNVDGERYPYSDNIVIPAGYSFFRINFASLNFDLRGRMTYSYMLDGYDKDWISSTDYRSVTYSRIPPGNYEFKVTMYDSSNHSGQMLSIPVRVQPSFWQSWIAILIYIFLSLLILAIIVKVIQNSFRLKNDVKLEQDINAIKARFYTNISHELRTPLTLILGGISEISHKGVTDEKNDYNVNLVYKNAKRMMTLVNQLLDIRTIEGGKMKLKVSQFDIVELVSGVYDDFKEMASERQIELRIIKSVDMLNIWGDRIRLEALVYNLITNAFKYTSDGGKIEVGVLYREGDTHFRLMVKDNGIGVPKDRQKIIFEPFFKGEGTNQSGMSSSGIGLSFCKEITEIHGGTIWVEDASVQGSKFFVRLPKGKDHFNEDNVEFVEMTTTVHEQESYGLSKYKLEPTYPEGAMKAMIVEDNAELRVYIYNCLINRYEVRDACNGKDALEQISNGWVPDILITDLMMPEMDGMELVNAMRADFNTSHIPVIMITARHKDDTQIKAIKYGADAYIAKPFTMELLIARIDNLLERRRSLITTLSARPEMAADMKVRKVEISPDEIVITDKDEALINKVMQWLNENVSDSDVTVEQLAVFLNMGRTSMYNKIKGLTGKSPVELIQDFRMQKATYYLKSGQYSVSETSYKVGFSDPGYFSRSFKKHFGVSPADYIKQNKKQ